MHGHFPQHSKPSRTTKRRHTCQNTSSAKQMSGPPRSPTQLMSMSMSASLSMSCPCPIHIHVHVPVPVHIPVPVPVHILPVDLLPVTDFHPPSPYQIFGSMRECKSASYISTALSHECLLSHVIPWVYSLYFKYLYCILVSSPKIY